jgi:ankyrin repeat protein
MDVDTSHVDDPLRSVPHIENAGKDAQINLHKYLKRDKFDKLSLLLEEHPLLVDQVDHTGRSLLHVAASRGLTVLVLALLELGAKVDLMDKQQNTALHYACYDENNAILKLLIEFNATVNVRDAAGKEPLHISCNQGNLEAVRILLLGGANPFALDNRRNSVLHLISSRGHADLAPTLLNALRNSTHSLENVAEFIDRTDWFGDTALHWACRGSKSAIAVALLQAGASNEIRNGFKKRPLDYCEKDTELRTLMNITIDRIQQSRLADFTVDDTNIDNKDRCNSDDDDNGEAGQRIRRNSLKDYDIESPINNFESEIQKRKALVESLEKLRTDSSDGQDMKGKKLLNLLTRPLSSVGVVYDLRFMSGNDHPLPHQTMSTKVEISSSKDAEATNSFDKTVSISSSGRSDSESPIKPMGTNPMVRSASLETEETNFVKLSEVSRNDMLQRDFIESLARDEKVVDKTTEHRDVVDGEEPVQPSVVVGRTLTGISVISAITDSSDVQEASDTTHLRSKWKSRVQNVTETKETGWFNNIFWRHSAERNKRVKQEVAEAERIRMGSPRYSELHNDKDFSLQKFSIFTQGNDGSTRNPPGPNDYDMLSHGTSEEDSLQSSTKQSVFVAAASSMYDSDSDSECDFDDFSKGFAKEKSSQSISDSSPSRNSKSSHFTKREGRGGGQVCGMESSSYINVESNSHEASDPKLQTQEVVAQTCSCCYYIRSRLEAASRNLRGFFPKRPLSTSTNAPRGRSNSDNILLPEESYVNSASL